jgi:ABC-type dipeptide/oligopeptide/nickel transport system ATPase subunit
MRDSLQSRISGLEARIAYLEMEESTLDKVAALFRDMLDREIVDNAKIAEGLLTEGLRVIFDDINLSVRADVDVQRGKVSVELVTIQHQSNGAITEAPSTDAFGGSVSVIQSVLLRIVVMTRRGMRPLLLLDESLAAVAEQYVPRVGSFLREICRRMSIDMLVVTHNPQLVESAHRAYRIKKEMHSATFLEVRT